MFRFTNLDQKPYWWDEVTNSIHSAGYSKQDFRDRLKVWQNKNITIQDLHEYQYPTSKTTSLDVVRALANGEPQSPPIYYLLSRWWTQLLGNSVTVQRSLSACISLLALPSMYWLCLELFNSSLAAWIGVMLITVSPFHLIFAQEVRIYVLWTVTILVSSASLLRAIRLQRKRDWGIYAASLTFSFYTFPFSILVAVGHGIHLTITEAREFLANNYRSRNRIKISKTFSNYLAASIASLVAFTPWIFFVIQINDKKMVPWRQAILPLADLLKYWLVQTSLIFADLNPEYRGGTGGADSSVSSFYDPLSFFPTILVWIIIVYALYSMIRNSPQPIWSFILPLILVTFLMLMSADLISGGMRSTVTRYLIPCYLGIQLSIVNLIHQQINFPKLRRAIIFPSKKILELILIIFLSTGVISCSLIIRSPSWWNKSIHSQNIPIANIINSCQNPLILTPENSAVHLLSISHNLDSRVTIRFVDKPIINQDSKEFSDLFLLNYPRKWLNSIQKENKFQLEEIYQGEVVKGRDSIFNFRLLRIL
ncbi:MAG: glycosyltransferase family 39 protein [Cyanobacteria bacterium P01_C01_bin.72]